MEIAHETDKHRFSAEVDGGTAEIEYTLSGDVMTITHTFVPDQARGQGLAGKLTTAALDHAREAGFKVVPQCPYVRDFIDRNPAYKDLLA